MSNTKPYPGGTAPSLGRASLDDGLDDVIRTLYPTKPFRIGETALESPNASEVDQPKDKKKRPSNDNADACLDERLSKIQKTKEKGGLTGGKLPMTKDLPLRKHTLEPPPRRNLLPRDQPPKDATTCQVPSELDWKKAVACTASWQAADAKINAQVTDGMVGCTRKLTFMENQEVALRHLAESMVDVITSLCQSKVSADQAREQRERHEAVIKAGKEAKAKAEHDAAIAREAARVAREENDKLVGQLAHAKRKHERFVNEVLPTALEHAREQAVVAFKDSKEFLSEYANGMRDFKARYIKLNPEAGQMDWSFLPANFEDFDSEEEER